MSLREQPCVAEKAILVLVTATVGESLVSESSHSRALLLFGRLAVKCHPITVTMLTSKDKISSACYSLPFAKVSPVKNKKCETRSTSVTSTSA